ncbi:MAG TPA: GTPase [Tepidisphaeraceae bacterium]|nr:GTPase [Tepidisphaeraceae bacterium]
MNKAMLLTPSGTAAVAVIRIDGPGVSDFLNHCFDRPVLEGKCVYGRIHNGVRSIDDAIVTQQCNSANLNLHGGLWIVHEVMELLKRNGFEIITYSPTQTWAMDGETELDREIAANLPLARTELTLRILQNQHQAWQQLNLRQPQNQKLEQMLADHVLEHLLNPPTVAIIGLPNVGKSTLANQLFGQERSITADLPGTTRDWVGELANIDGLVVKLIDTPGQRISTDTIETRAIEVSGPVISAADLVVLVMDPTQEREPQISLSNHWPDAIVVINKSDRAQWPGDGIRTVATTGTGIDLLRTEIRRRFGIFNIDESAPRCWTNRQKEEIRNSLRANSAIST